MQQGSAAPRRSQWLRRLLRRWALVLVGLLLGAVTGLTELVFVLVGGFLASVAVSSRLRERVVRRVFSGARTLANLERRRLAVFLDSDNVGDFRGDRAFRYIALRSLIGILGGAVCFLVFFGAVGAPVTLLDYVSGADLLGRKIVITTYLVGFSSLLVYLVLTGIAGVASADRALARRFIGPSREEVLADRVETLSTSRAEVMDAVNHERRRIERDLHDGVQQRLVALGMLIGRARRSGGAEAKMFRLLEQAHEESRLALRDLRDVAWRVYPAALDAGGLRPALDVVADRAALPVRIVYDLDGRPGEAVETVAYFVVSEAVTNAVKHSRADAVTVHVGLERGKLVLRVVDDGVGGATSDGAGLSGLARRVAALDGEFRVDSPVGGPTTINAELPCE